MRHYLRCIVGEASSQIISPVQRIMLVDEVTRQTTGDFESNSLPGHLIHVVLAGEVNQFAEGRPEHFGEGDVVWYHENEPVRGEILRAPWRFITINFEAVDMAPPPDDKRVMRAGANTAVLARSLLELWQDGDSSSLARDANAMIILLQLIMDIKGHHTLNAVPVYPLNARDCWWMAEKKMRQMLDQPLKLKEVAEIVGMSERTVIRACKAATGMPPAARIRELRHTHALNLLQHSSLTVTEIAYRVGYSRVQEFSRDFKKRSGMTPREARAVRPSYLERKNQKR
ncbi:hypothetical protein NT6N_15890 [Oceaniferula spumae]|uniref:HTH araC/xylS-type domain-containing protein n=1 Tax=Oceaniferula spumae TaxID=2979115 RepID=A0AAT9FKJ9_9BACT